MNQNFSRVVDQYRGAWKRYGRSSDSLLMPKGRHEDRFRALEPYFEESLTILDYGCGLGFLYPFLRKRFESFAYTGVDVIEEFICDCAENFQDAVFSVVDPGECPVGEFDVVFASGVFNLQSHDSLQESRQFAFQRIAELFETCNRFIVVDFLSSNVDFMQERAVHFTPGEVIDFVQQRLSRKFVLRHDLLPYEFSIIVWKDDEIAKPQNIYRSQS